MDRILVASDLSERSDRAVRRALRLARKTGAQCEVLTVIDDGLPEGMAEEMRSRAALQLERQVGSAGCGDSAPTIAAVIGDPVATVPARAAEIGADLLVVGLHRPRPFLDALRETTMERLVRLTDAPVLLVRNPAGQDYARVLAPVSFSPACAAAIRAAAQVAPGIRPDGIHAVDVPFSGLTGQGAGSAMERAVTAEADALAEAWRAQWDIGPGALSLSIATESLTRLIEQRLAATPYDLIAIGAHTRPGPFAPGLGSFTARLIRQPPADLLVARP